MKRDLEQRLYKYSVEIISFVDTFPKNTSAYVIAQQLARSGTSVTANVAEAKAARSKKDYVNYYTHALKSANESKVWIALARDTQSVSKTRSEKLLKETEEIANILGKSIITMKKNSN